MGIKKCNLPEGFIKTLNVLLDCLPFKVVSILSLGLEQVVELGHFYSIKFLMLLDLLLSKGDLIFDLFLFGTPVLLPSQVLVLGLFHLLLQQTNLLGVKLFELY